MPKEGIFSPKFPLNCLLKERRLNQQLFPYHPDIRLSRTPSGAFYASEEVFELSKEKVFRNSWQWIGVQNAVREAGSAFPFELLEGFLGEPLVLTRADDGQVRLLSNVCTHRGNLLARKPGACKVLRCSYHGRRFGLDGQLQSAPGFEDREGFPEKDDHLPSLPLAEWGQFLFGSLGADFPFDELISGLKPFLQWIPMQLRLDGTRTKDFVFDASWMLYVENYLEGFHIPFVHPTLNAVIDVRQYETLRLERGVLQKAIAKDEEVAFDLPPQSPDYGKRIAAYYFWLFPNTMLNFYPWGLSINVVKPLGIQKTKVSFITYVSQPQLLDTGAGAALEKVEMEDEDVVLSVQEGLKSQIYAGGKYAPEHEQGVHHFHGLLWEALNR
jgi:choline monooxygenase